MLILLFRHHRRILLFSGGMSFLTSVLLFSQQNRLSVMEMLGLFASFLLIYIGGAISLYRLNSSQRGVLEVAGLAASLSSIILLILPRPQSLSVVLGLTLFGGIILSLWAFLNSQMSKHIGARTTWRARHACCIPYPAKLIWRHAVPGAAAPNEHCTGQMISADVDAEDPATLHVQFRGRTATPAKYAITFLEQDAPSICRFYFEGTEASGTQVDGVFSFKITTLRRDYCQIIAVEERSGLSLGELVERWFDDVLGFQNDRLRLKLDKLYGEQYGVAKAGILQFR